MAVNFIAAEIVCLPADDDVYMLMMGMGHMLDDRRTIMRSTNTNGERTMALL